jgi:hypothetical protein
MCFKIFWLSAMMRRVSRFRAGAFSDFTLNGSVNIFCSETMILRMRASRFQFSPVVRSWCDRY